MAIRLGRTGALTGTDGIAWSTARGVSYTPSPLLHDGKLYVVSDAGLCQLSRRGDRQALCEQERLPKPYNFKASPVGADGKLYLATEEGDVVVLGDAFEVLATNTLADQSFIASPVVVAGDIYLRSRTHLFRIDGSAQLIGAHRRARRLKSDLLVSLPPVRISLSPVTR